MIALEIIRPEMTDVAWKMGASGLEKCLFEDGTTTPSQLKTKLFKGELELLAYPNTIDPLGWAAVNFVQYDNCRSMFIFCMTCKKDTRKLIEELKRYAKSLGARFMEFICAPPQERLFKRYSDFYTPYNLFRCDL